MSSICFQVQDPETGFRWQVFQDEGFDPQITQLQTRPAAGVGFLDPSGQRAFRTDGYAVAAGEHMAYEQAGSKD